MTETVIDRLVVALGLDGSGYKKGADAALAQNKRLKDNAQETAKSLTEYGKAGGEFFGEITKRALEFFAVIAAGRGVTELFTQAVRVGNATGILARNTGTTVASASAFANALQNMGLNAGAAGDALTSLSQQQAAIALGNPQQALGLEAIMQRTHIQAFNDGNPQSPRDPALILEDLAGYLHNLSPQMAQAQGAQFGLPPDMITLLQTLGKGGLEKALGVDVTQTDTSAKAAAALTKSFGGLETQIDALSAVLMTLSAPMLVKGLNDFMMGIWAIDQVLQGKLPASILLTPLLPPANAAPIPNGGIPDTGGFDPSGAIPVQPDGYIPNTEPQTTLTPTQIAAQIQQESGGKQFDKDGKPLISSSGAVGIMQLLPSTAEAVAAKHNIPWDSNAFYNDAFYNRNLGVLYMGDLLKQFNGNYPAALAAYNAGPNNPGVQAYAKDQKLSDLNGQTRNYVTNIIGSANAATPPSLPSIIDSADAATPPPLSKQATPLPPLPASVTAIITGLRATKTIVPPPVVSPAARYGASPAKVAPSSAASSKTVHISTGPITVHTAAKDAKGTGKAVANAVRQAMVTQANSGLV